MAFITVENPEDDIWKTNPSLELISEFKYFKEKEGPKRSSDIIKAIYYIWDPKSDLRDSALAEDKLIKDINESIIGEPDFNWDDYDHIREFYMENNITKLESLLLRYEKEIKDLNSILEKWKWDKKNIKERADAVKQYKSLFDEYIEVRDKAKAEAEELSEMLGGYQKSMIEGFGE